MESNKIVINLPGPTFLLFCIFLVLKLSGKIAWSWLWVCAPLWIGAIFTVSIFVLFFALICVAALFSK